MNMSVDIDNFIRDQKSKIATERQYLSNQNLSFKRSDSDYKIDKLSSQSHDKEFKSNFSSDDNFIFKMKEGENMKNKYKQELRNDLTNVTEYNRHVDTSPRREKTINKNETDGLLRGLGYSNSATKRREHIRNQEYNEFKKIEEENFKNRFTNKKNVGRSEMQSENFFFQKRNPITSDFIEPRTTGVEINNHRPPTITKIVSPNALYPRDSNRLFENKLDMLERKVEDLRKFKIQDINMSDRNENPSFNVFPVNNTNLYERPLMGKLNFRSLEETENQLKEADQKYDESKNRILKSFRSGRKKIQSILDDESILENESLDKNFPGKESENFNSSNNRNSIIPLGRMDEGTAKRKKQEQYRKDLQDQMKEKWNNSKRVYFRSNEEISFFDKFGRRDPERKDGFISNRKSESARVEHQNRDKENDYFYYASRNPLDDMENNNYVPSSFNIANSTKPNENTTYSSSYLSIGSRNDSYQPKSQSQKDNYGEELKRQIEERKIRKEMEKKRQDEYERRKNEEILNYDPFGRGGGGAPLKDIRGETVADLKNFKFDTITIPPSSFRPQSDYYRDTIKAPVQSDPNESKTFARGGHGIFGQALSEEAKMKNEKYKEELQVQIEIKRRQKEIERDSERIREAKELEKLEKERKQIQLEMENERKIQMQKEIERTQRLEESRLAAKENKFRASEEVKVEEPYRPPLSPYQVRESPKPKSPIIIRERTPIHIVRENSEITNKLNILRNEIKNRAAQVEKEIARQNDDVEIFDARLATNKHITNQNNTDYNSNIFQSVLDNKGPLSVRRGYLKSKQDVQKSRLNTEAYLDEHLKQQEKVLQRMGQHDFSPFELGMGKMNPRDLGIRPQSQMSNQLESETNFITFNQSREFPLKSSLSFISDNEYPFLKPQSPKPFKLNYEFGSNTSLNIDDLTRKNKQRLRKLQKTQHENESNQSPEEILNKIRSLDDNDRYSFNGH